MLSARIGDAKLGKRKAGEEPKRKQIFLMINGMPEKFYEITCSQCGKKFINRSSNIELCSDECRKARRYEQTNDVNCAWCGKVFHQVNTRQRFCCHHCSVSWNNYRRHGDKEERAAKKALLDEFMRLAPLEQKRKVSDPERLIVSYESEPFPDGCVFVHVTSSSGYWKKGVVEDVVG